MREEEEEEWVTSCGLKEIEKPILLPRRLWGNHNWTEWLSLLVIQYNAQQNLLAQFCVMIERSGAPRGIQTMNILSIV